MAGCFHLYLEESVILGMRLDKFLWSVRLFKTRALAAKACTSGKVKLNDSLAKPSRLVQAGDKIAVNTTPVWRSYMVHDLPKSRIGAKLLSQFLSEETPAAVLEKLALHQKMNSTNRLLGIKGRPTKKDRRDLDKIKKDEKY